MSAAITEDKIRGTIERSFGPKIEFAYLLGSAGTERFHKESDIDLAIYFKEIPELTERSQMSAQLFDHFHTEIDLIVLNTADLIFTRQVLETGRLLFCASPGVLLNWKTDQLSQYPDFKRSRAIIESNILNRKSYVRT